MIFTQDSGLQDGNTRNGRAIGQVHEANLHKLDANVPNDADFNIWLPLALVYEGRSSYARVLIEIDACNGFSDNMVMDVPNLEGLGYTKETILNKVDKGKGGSYGDDDEGSIEVKKNKSRGNNGGTKNIKPVSVKPKTQYRLKVNQSTEGNNGEKNFLTSSNSSKKTSMTNALTSGNGTFPLSNSFEALNVDDPANEKVESGNKGECMLVDDDGKPLEKVDYLDDHDSEDEVEPIDNEMANFLAS
ncbi:hypothetical protein Tco_1166919 [Tanacetum coccineum]